MAVQSFSNKGLVRRDAANASFDRLHFSVPFPELSAR